MTLPPRELTFLLAIWREAVAAEGEDRALVLDELRDRKAWPWPDPWWFGLS